MAAQAVIDARDLSLTFTTADGPVYALEGINLTVNDGDFVSSTGPSGCGKTTLLRCVADLEQPTPAGGLAVNGLPSAGAARLARSNTAMCSRRRRSIRGARWKRMSGCRWRSWGRRMRPRA